MNLQSKNALFKTSSDFTDINKMRINLLVLSALVLASIGCTGSQEIVEPNRDDFNAGEVKTYTTVGGGEEDTADD